MVVNWNEAKTLNELSQWTFNADLDNWVSFRSILHISALASLHTNHFLPNIFSMQII